MKAVSNVIPFAAFTDTHFKANSKAVCILHREGNPRIHCLFKIHYFSFFALYSALKRKNKSCVIQNGLFYTICVHAVFFHYFLFIILLTYQHTKIKLYWNKLQAKSLFVAYRYNAYVECPIHYYSKVWGHIACAPKLHLFGQNIVKYCEILI